MKKLIWTNEELAQGSPEWLEFRSHGLGGSEIASLLHVNPYETLVETWEKKVNPQPRRDEELEAHILRGTQLEPIARAHYEALTGLQAEQLCLLHPEHHWMRTSLDGITARREFVLEIKCPKSLDNHRRQIRPAGAQARRFRGVCAEKGKPLEVSDDFSIPAYRYPQMQHQLAVCGAHFGTKVVHYFSFYDAEHWCLIQIPVDEAYIAELIRRESIFFHQFVVPRLQPPPYLFAAEEPLAQREVLD